MLVAVGGHSRNLGKTSVVAGLIRSLRDLNWTAIKITQYGEGACLHGPGDGCCETASGDPYTLTEEFAPGKTDSGRFLAAGARRSFWLRTPAGCLPRAERAIRRILDQSENVIAESGRLPEVVRPDLFLMLLDFACADFKPSGARLLEQADACLVIDRGLNVPVWEGIVRDVWKSKPWFAIQPPRYVTAEVAAFVRERLSEADR